MRKSLALVGGLVLLGGIASAPAALADSSPSSSSNQFTETATSTSYTQGQLFTDTAGNRFYQDSIYTGNVSGSPINGTFRFDGNFYYPAGSSTGVFQASFVDTDGSGNSVFGDMAGSVVFDSSGNATDSGRFTIRGGTGSYLGARGGGSFSGTVTNSSQSTTTTFDGVWAIGSGRAARDADMRPGNGFGDRNHVHMGSMRHGHNWGGDD